jgi:hypothetical protein
MPSRRKDVAFHHNEENTMPTEQEAIERERAAFVEGCEYAGSTYLNESRRKFRKREASLRYPLTQTVPREVADPHGTAWKYRVVDNVIQGKWNGHIWSTDVPSITPERIRIWANLLDNPTIEQPL